MKRGLLTILAGAVVSFLTWTGVSNGAVNVYHEDFTTTQYTDPLNTTAWWDTVSGELRLNPFGPTLAGSYDTPGYANAVTVSGDYAVVADGASGLQMIEISNPTNPTLLGNYNTPGYANAVTVSGDYAFVADGASGLQVIDISDPANPAFLGTYDTPGYAYSITVSGDYAFVADQASGLQVIDISDPTNPTLLGTYDTPGDARGVTVSGDYVFVADQASGLQVIDISDPTNPTLLGTYDTPAHARDVTVSGDYVFVADQASGLQVIDISDPTNPTLLGTYDTPGDARSVTVSGDYAFVADHASGLQVIDISDPANLTLLETCDTPGSAYGVTVSGDYAFVADYVSGLQVIKIFSGPINPKRFGSHDTPDWAYDVTVSGDYAFMADYASGLQVIDISDPANLTLLGTYDTPGSAYGVTVSGDCAFVADGDSGLQVIDISDPTNPILLGNYDTPAHAIGVMVLGDHAFVADQASGLQVIDISDLTNPTLLGTYDTPGNAMGVMVSGDYAFVADFITGLQVIDISDPTNPTLLGTYNTPAYARRVTVSGDYAFVADQASGLQVIDISDPTNPTLLGTYNTPDYAQNVTVSGDYAFVAGSYTGGLVVIDISDPTNPTLLGTCNTPSSALGVTVSGDYAFVADGGSGLQVITVFQSEVNLDDNVGRSLALDETDDMILRAWLAATQTDSVAWELSADGGTNWQGVEPDASWNLLTTQGTDIMWRSTLTSMVVGDNPAVSGLTLAWIYEYGVIDAIVDVPDDQGGWVRIHFTRSGLDFPDEVSLPIENYGIWQLVENPSLVAAINTAPFSTTDKSLAGEKSVLTGVPVITYGGRTYVQSEPGPAAASFPLGTWEHVLSVPAIQRDDYVARVSTTADSSASGPGYSVYLITAHTTTPSIWYASPPDTGYSVDNIAPAVPEGFLVVYNTGSGNYLSWDPCPDEDFLCFRVYRSADPGFVPSPATLVFSTGSTDWNDPDYDGCNVHYKITALDDADNESDPASAGTATGIEERVMPKRVTLGQNVPNPFNPSTTISIGLPSSSSVRLSIFDVNGRLVRTLVDGSVQAGFRSFTWDGRDNRGQPVASGVYFYQMKTMEHQMTRKMLLIK